MFKNYFKISWRSLVHNRAYTTINVAGMALSMACGILIFTLVTFNLSYDNFHPNANRIYRCVTEEHSDVIDYDASVPPAFGSAFRRDYTFAEEVARIANFRDETVNIKSGAETKVFKEADGINFVEATYFNIFNFTLVEGNIKTALAQPNTAVITQRAAEKYFGLQSAVGKILTIDHDRNITVTGILKNLPANTDAKGDVFISYATLKGYRDFFADDNAWGGIRDALQCFVKLRPGVSAASVESVLPAYVKKYRPKNKNVHYYKLQPMAEVHFDARYGAAMEKRTLWILSFIGIFIIITACVNFINLATAQALKRSKEVGVRKVLGSLRSQLFWQFIAETGMIALAGIIMALGIAYVLLPHVNTLFKAQMDINVFTNIKLLLFLLALAVVITLLAGAYPGIILSNFKPVAALKGKISQQQIGGFNTRRGLIITQFAISQVLITGMIVIAVQMHYAKDSDLGFTKDAIVLVHTGTHSTSANIKTFESSVAAIPGVQKVSACYTAPSAKSEWSANCKYNNDAEDEPFSVSMKAADDQYVSTFGLEIVAGRNLYPSDTLREFVVNEAFVRRLNLTSPQDVIGKKLTASGHMTAPIVGVMKDFHDKSFRSDINPVCIYANWDSYSQFAVKIDMGNAKQTLAAIGKTWNNIYPNQVYDFQFLDDAIVEFYATEQTMLTLVQAFTFVAIFIGCLGLYGLVMFMAMQKTKEIGIRKVLGSTVAQIMLIFGKEFSRLIAIAFVIATPIAWWLMNSWLQDFKFRISISPLFFAATIGLIFVIAFLTVGYQSIKAALMNPVKAIKSE